MDTMGMSDTSMTGRMTGRDTSMGARMTRPDTSMTGRMTGRDTSMGARMTRPDTSMRNRMTGRDTVPGARMSRPDTGGRSGTSASGQDSAKANQTESGVTDPKTGKSTLGKKVTKTRPDQGPPVTSKGDTLKKGGDSVPKSPR
jgi:hypothetical protein